jgi:hypothetical protein
MHQGLRFMHSLKLLVTHHVLGFFRLQGAKALVMRLRVTCVLGGSTSVEDVAEVNFPAGF